MPGLSSRSYPISYSEQNRHAASGSQCTRLAAHACSHANPCADHNSIDVHSDDARANERCTEDAAADNRLANNTSANDVWANG